MVVPVTAERGDPPLLVVEVPAHVPPPRPRRLRAVDVVAEVRRVQERGDEHPARGEGAGDVGEQGRELGHVHDHHVRDDRVELLRHQSSGQALDEVGLQEAHPGVLRPRPVEEGGAPVDTDGVRPAGGQLPREPAVPAAEVEDAGPGRSGSCSSRKGRSRR